MLVKTLKRHGYAKRIHVQGEEYEMANEKHVRILEAVGKIRRVPVKVAPHSHPSETAVIEPVVEEKPAKRKSSTKGQGGRKYKRKDMVAEE